MTMTNKEKVLKKLKEMEEDYLLEDAVLGKPTFFGVLKKYFYETDNQGKEIGISKEWKNYEKTVVPYLGFYEKNILPMFPNPDAALETFSSEDFLAPIDILVKLGYEKVDKEIGYSEGHIDTHKRLIRNVYQKALEKGIITVPVLEGTSITQKNITDEEISTEKKRLKKSFSPIQEMAFFNRLLVPMRTDLLNVPGQNLGLLFMATLGLRNHEAAGLCFDDLLPFQTSSNSHRLLVYRTTVRSSNKLKGGGKTPNAPRSLSILDSLFEIVEKRKQLIKKHYQDLGITIDNIGSLPIACKGTDYEKRCSAGDIGNAGKEHLMALFYDPRRLAVIEEILRSETAKKNPELFTLGCDEKNPTTYLLRRNAVTRMYHCGLTESEIQFFTGHKIENIYEDRADYVNEDLLLEINSKLERHPICQFIQLGIIEPSPEPDTIILSENVLQASISDTSSCTIKIESADYDRKLTIVIDETEPYDHMSGKLEATPSTANSSATAIPQVVKETMNKITNEDETPKTVNINKDIWRMYYDAYLILTSSNPPPVFSEDWPTSNPSSQ